MDPFVAEIRIFPFNFAQGLGILRWATPAAKPEYGALLPVGNNLWR